MKTNLTLLFFSLMALVLCTRMHSKSIDIKNTKWVYEYGPGVADSLIFKDTMYYRYSAELDSRYYGTFFFIKDTIYMHVLGEIWMYEPPRFVPYEAESNWRQRAIINEDGMMRLLSGVRLLNDSWVESGSVPEATYVMKKTE